jgi:DNA processing protein
MNNELVMAICVSELPASGRFQSVQKVLLEDSWNCLKDTFTERELEAAQSVIDECRALGVLALPVTDPMYPKSLRESEAPPPVLYLKGSLTGLMSKIAVAVVGARSATVDGCVRVSELSEELARCNIVVVSGLALGIDGAAHRGALNSGSGHSTVAVLAHGLDMVYPPSHTGLAGRIVDAGGLLISEYPPRTKPMKHHFLARNRIVAGLSRGVIVAEAGERSGSLVTAQFAINSGRDVFALVGEAQDDASIGCQNLVEQGAIPIASASGVLREYGIDLARSLSESAKPRKVVLGLASFMEITGVSFHELLRLELDGIIERTAGNQVKVSASLIGR